MKKYKIGGQFSGVGAFDQALIRLGIDYENIYQAEWDKYARKTYLNNHEEPKYYIEDVHNTPIEEITEKYGSLDLMMFSPPCQAFSLAGNRKGESDERGVLFYNSHEFIIKNNPRFFIFENVKGLLSDDNGNTFNRWLEYLGGKSINGMATMFPYEHQAPYHIYWQVLNAKDYGVPQNRERVFIVGIRDDIDNVFRFPKPIRLEKRLKDVLESEVNEKYYLSDKTILKVEKSNFQQEKNRIQLTDICSTLLSRDYKDPKCVKVKSATSKGFELAEIGEDSINLEHPNSETRRGRVGKKVAQTLTTSCNQGVAEIIQYNFKQKVNIRKHNVDIIGLQKLLNNHRKITIRNICEALNKPKTEVEHWFRTDKSFSIPDPDAWFMLKDLLSIDTNEFDCQITEFIEKDNEFESANRIYDERGISPTLTCTDTDKKIINSDYRIRKLTPRECFRLMDFPDSFDFSVVSDSQAYKQSGNSIVVNVLAMILKNLPL